MLNIHAHIIAFNESFIRHTLNHYSAFCSKIFVYDNMSTDRTAEIARSYPKVSIVQFDTGGSIDERNYLKIKNECWKGSEADYVIVCDTDELLWSENIGLDISHQFMNGISVPKVIGYNMYCETFPVDYSRPITEQIKSGSRAEHFNKSIIFNPKIIREINYLPGCHISNPEGAYVTSMVTHPLKLLHYKYLGRDSLAKKHQVYKERISYFNRMNGFGKEYLEGIRYVDAQFDELSQTAKPILP